MEKMAIPCRKAFAFSFVISFLIIALLEASEAQNDSNIQLSPDSNMTYEEEYRLFELAEESNKSHLNRKKRFIYLNVDTNMAVALLVSIPLTLVLPSMTNLFNSWRRKRSIDSTNSWDFQDHYLVKPDMEKVFTYFQLLDIPEPSCQLRAVCEFSADSDKFSPLSDVILQRIKNPKLPALVYLENHKDASNLNTSLLSTNSNGHDGATSLYDLYNKAADHGQEYGNEKCHQQYSKACQYPMEKLLNMPVIRFWNALQSMLKLSFKDVAMK